MIPPNFTHIAVLEQQAVLYQHHRIEGVVT